MSGVIEAIGTKMLTSVVVWTAKGIKGTLVDNQPFKLAITKTATEFSTHEITPSLEKWCGSAEFETIAVAIRAGSRPILDAEIVKSYIAQGEFYAGETTEEDAERILLNFFGNLEAEIIKAPDGLVTVARRQEALHQDTRETVREMSVVTMGELADLKQMIASLQASAPEKSVTPQEAQEKAYLARVDEAHKLIKSGKFKIAISILHGIRQDISEKNVSISLLRRIATNLGYCHHSLNENSEAESEFQNAYALDIHDSKSASNIAALKLQKGQIQEALNLLAGARDGNHQDSALTANYIAALLILKRVNEFAQLLKDEPWIENDADCQFAIGYRFFEDSVYDKAERHLRLANGIHPGDPKTLTLLAHSLIRPTQKTLQSQPIFKSQFSKDFDANLTEAEALLTQALHFLSETDDLVTFTNACILRADVRRMRGDDAGALADCENALARQPADEMATQLKAVCLLNSHKIEEAITCFERIKTAELKSQVLLPFAVAYSVAKRPNQVVALVEPRLSAGIQDAQDIRLADLLVGAYTTLSNTSAAEKLITELREKWPNNPETLMVLAHNYLQNGKKKNAADAFTEALSYASGTSKYLITVELADLYYTEEKFSQAADLYAAIVDVIENEDLRERYLASLFNAGSYKQALDFARKLGKVGRPTAFVSNVEAKALIELGDLSSALILLERLASEKPSAHVYKIEAAQCAYRLVKHADAKRLISNIKFNEIKNDGQTLIRVAQMRALLGMDDVLSYAYQARRAGFHSPEIQAAYAMLICSRDDADVPPLDCEVCTVDCGILLKTPDGVASYTILDESDAAFERGELTIKQAEEMQLLGRKKGDKFVLKKNAWQDYTCEVLAVQNKYGRALQETMEKFPTLFPTSKLIQPIRGDYEEFKEGFLHQLDEDQKQTNEIVAFYEKGQLTIESLAALLQTTVVRAWGMLVGGHYSKLIAHSGLYVEFEKECSTISAADSIVLELTAILSLAHLGLLNILPKRFKRILCTQVVLDSLTETVNLHSTKKGGLTLGKVGKEYVKDEITPEREEKIREFYDSIREFLISHTTIVPVGMGGNEGEFKWNELKKLLGQISTSVIQVAREQNAILLSDDAMLRVLARNEWSIGGAWTQSTLYELLRSSHISEGQYVEAVCKLTLLNYKFVFLKPEMICWILEKTKFNISSEVQLFFSVFRGPACTVESAAGVLSEVLKRIWIEKLMFETKLKILEEILAVMVSGRQINESLAIFLVVLKGRFFLMPDAYEAIARIIEPWRRQQIIKTGLSGI